MANLNKGGSVPGKDYLNEALEYNPDTGILRWKYRPVSHFQGTASRTSKHACNQWNSRFAGRVTNCATRNRGKYYITVNLNYNTYNAHRLIWMMCYGEVPLEIDHINGDGTDNRLANLRNVTHLENSKNRRRCTTNKTGILGVSEHNRLNRWRARINADGGRVNLYWGSDYFEACCARKSAELKYGFHENHGDNRSV